MGIMSYVGMIDRIMCKIVMITIFNNRNCLWITIDYMQFIAICGDFWIVDNLLIVCWM